MDEAYIYRIYEGCQKFLVLIINDLACYVIPDSSLPSNVGIPSYKNAL